jgi:hypothetical protein
MSKRVTLAVLVLAVAAGGAVFYSTHNHKGTSRASTVSLPPAVSPSSASSDPVGTDTPDTSSAAASSSSRTGSLAVDTKKPIPADVDSPLHAGESWDYSATVSKLSSVANLHLKVVEKRNFLGKSVWHLQAVAHTENPLRMVFALDDQFDSYSDAATLVSMQYEMRLNEKGETLNSVQRMSPRDREPAPDGASAARVLPGTRDPLGMMQYLRTVDWTKVPQVRSPVYDGHKLYEVYAQLQSRGEQITVPAGSFNALKIDLRVLDNGQEMKDAHFTLFLSNDEARLPVLLEAVMPFATARVEMVKAH